jgi:hypothetical protein
MQNAANHCEKEKPKADFKPTLVPQRRNIEQELIP